MNTKKKLQNKKESLKLITDEQEIETLLKNFEDIEENVELIQINEEIEQIQTKEKFNSSNADMELVWKDLNIIAKAPTKGYFSKTQVGEDKIILNNVSGRTRSGESLAIIRASGAGKTTLLNYLSRKIESGNLKVTGEVLLNGEVINNDRFDLIASYVMQDDILEQTMTPLEILMFTAKLRLELSPEEIEKKVEKIIKDLHLTKCQNTRIGSNLQRGISGGERKRTSIGVELISDPKIIFLDEPTTGLDSYNAYEVIKLLRTLSTEGKIIIFTIHQPSSELFFQLDKLCILALGKTVFSGNYDKSLNCFESFGLPVPLNYNPFEHFIEMTNYSSSDRNEVHLKYPELQSINNLQERYENFISQLNKKYEENKENYQETKLEDIIGFTLDNEKLFTQKNIKKSFFYEFYLLFLRNILVTMRNPMIMFIKIVQGIVTGALVSALFVSVTKDFSGIQDRLGIFNTSIVFAILTTGATAILSFVDEKIVFLRERSNKLYSVSSYFFSKTLSELPGYFITNTLFSLIIYFSIELNDTYSYKYWVFVAILNFSSIAGLSLTYLIATFSKNKEALVSLNNALNFLLMLLSGFYANADNFAPYLIPFKYISSFKYAFQTLIHNEFTDSSPYNCHNLHFDQCNPMPNRFTFLEPYYMCFIAKGCLIIFFKGLALMMLYFFAKIKV